MVELFINSEDPDQTPRSTVSDLGLHRLPGTRWGVLMITKDQNNKNYTIVQYRKTLHDRHTTLTPPVVK